MGEVMGEYESYSWIQRHMNISESLFSIDQQGKHLLSEIREKKNTKTSKRGVHLSHNFNTIYESINETINVRRFKSRLYLTLQYYLDEALFIGVNEMDEKFYIEDDAYDLTKLYFDQQSWIPHNVLQKFSFINDLNLNIEEALLIKCFFMNYNQLLEQLNSLVSDIIVDAKCKKKIKYVIKKIRQKHSHAVLIIDEIINSDVESAD